MHREAFVTLINIKCRNIKTFTFNLGMQHRAEHQEIITRRETLVHKLPKQFEVI